MAISPSVALADPCKAIPDKGAAPDYLSPGRVFAGSVSYVGDGDSLCVAVGRAPADWVEVRLQDFYAPELREPGGAEAKATLARIALGKHVECTASHQSYDRVVAKCLLAGVSLAEYLRRSGVAQGGRGR